ncbi:WSC domain-containing protein [Collybia nuda]|uniref:WSC domain-containing protein n=1 Tax=Collybia nuda TaxID=64659 RepID=A0A9P5Y1X8_9AGAR|nr:WSC domain-containing protein [Collybia nuda]
MLSLLLVASLPLFRPLHVNAVNIPRDAGDPLIPSGWTALGCFRCSVDCDNTVNSPGVASDDSGCNVPCTGDTTHNCGGADRVYIAQRDGGVPPSTTITPTSTSTSATPSSTASIKTTVGTWQYKGCFEDFGPRILQHQFTTSKTVEACTANCAASGYGLAGLEFGGECWCDTYLPFGQQFPDSECSMVCGDDPTELCGAGNRLALYQNSVATPPSASLCLSSQPPGTAVVPRNFQNTGIVAVDRSGNNGLQIYGATPVVTLGDTGPEYLLLSHCRNCPFEDVDNFEVSPTEMFVYARAAISLFPRVGESPLFVSFSQFRPYSGYCAFPNPISPTGPFIGFPVLATAGRVDLWSLCTNTTADGRLDVVYSAVADHPNYDLSACTPIYLELVPSYALPNN